MPGITCLQPDKHHRQASPLKTKSGKDKAINSSPTFSQRTKAQMLRKPKAAAALPSANFVMGEIGACAFIRLTAADTSRAD